MANDPDRTAQDVSPDQHFVLLDETELHLPMAGEVVVMAGDGGESFWQDASGAASPLPALDELVSDHSGHAASAVPAGFETVDQTVLAEPCLLTSDPDLPAATRSLVDIIVDDGSGGPFVA